MATRLTFSTPLAGLSWERDLPHEFGLLSTSARKLVLQSATQGAMDYWIAKYLPMKFTKYVEVAGGYTVAASTRRQKRRRARAEYPDAILPNVWTGETRAAARSARFEGRGTSTRYTGKVVMNLPSYVNYNPITNQTVRSITQGEGNAIAARFFQLVEAILATSDYRIKRERGWNYRITPGTIERVVQSVNGGRVQRSTAGGAQRQSAGG